LDFKQVKPYLHIGNAVFESDKTIAEIKPTLEKMLSESFHYQAFVQLYNYNILLNIINRYPFKKEEVHYAYVILLITKPFLRNWKAFQKAHQNPPHLAIK